MEWYWWFVIGGGVSLLLSLKGFLVNPVREFLIWRENHWIQGAVAAFVGGAIIIGTPLMLIFG